MAKIDFKNTLKPLYNPPIGEFEAVEVPQMQFVKVDGDGDPNTAPVYRSAVEWLHVGSYDAEGPVLARLHGEVMPNSGMTFNGPHHEIYLSDPPD